MQDILKLHQMERHIQKPIQLQRRERRGQQIQKGREELFRLKMSINRFRKCCKKVNIRPRKIFITFFYLFISKHGYIICRMSS